MELGAPLIPAEAVEPVWFGLVDHVEDLAFEADGTVWCGGEEGQVYRGRLDGAPEIVARTPGRTYGFALGPDGACYCADVADPGIYRIDSEGEVERVSAGTADRPALLPNDLAFLPSGELLFSDSGNWGGDDGCIYAVGHGRVDAGGRTRPAPPTRTASASRRMGARSLWSSRRFQASASSRSAPTARCRTGGVLVELPGTVPDGLLYDNEGRLLISFWSPDAVLRLEADGELTTVVNDPLRVALNQPTNIAFVPGTNRLVAANIGDRYLSVFEYA